MVVKTYEEDTMNKHEALRIYGLSCFIVKKYRNQITQQPAINAYVTL